MMMNRREIMTAGGAALATGVAGRGLARGSEPRLIAEADLAPPEQRHAAILLARGELLGAQRVTALPAGRYAARLSSANQVLLRSHLRDRRVAVAIAGDAMLFHLAG